MKYVWIIRHAKAADGSPDHDRPLSARGLADGERMQAHLQAVSHPASWVWQSSAQRAQTTAAFIGKGFKANVVTAHELYLANPETIVDVIQHTPKDHTSVAVVAHNPGLTYAINLLTGDTATANLPTLGCALIEFEADTWSEIAFGKGTLVTLITPKSLR